MLILLIPATTWLFGMHYLNWADLGGEKGGKFGGDFKTTALLIASGPITVIPFLFFTYATQHIRFATAGLIQFINPTIQFLIAVFIFGEALTIFDFIAFPLIWCGLLIYAFESLRKQRITDAPAKPIGSATGIAH